MIIRPEDADKAERSRNHAHACKMKALNAGLEPHLVGHAYVAQAMKLWFNCDNDKAYALASGFMVLAFAENAKGDDTGKVIAEYALRRASNDPKLVEDMLMLA